jgi:predicted transcriptional regulator
MRFSDDDIRKELRDRISGATLRGVARELGVSPAMVSQVVYGNFPPGPKIAAALGYADDGLRWIRKTKRK